MQVKYSAYLQSTADYIQMLILCSVWFIGHFKYGLRDNGQNPINVFQAKIMHTGAMAQNCEDQPAWVLLYKITLRIAV